jgi:heme exporter protein B
MMTPFARAVFTVIRKDMLTELRSRELVSAMALFTLLSVLVFSFALELDRLARQEVVSGVLWVTLIFASILGLNRSLALEHDQGNLDAMLLAPIDRTAIFIGKAAGNFLFTLAVGLILLPLITVLYNINLVRPLMIITLALGTLGLAAVGTLLATMTAQTRSRETLLPIVMMPVALPVLLTVVRATAGIIDDQFEINWLLTLALIDMLYIGLGILLFDYVIED